jgi:uncharacterized membrane protein
VVCPKALQTAKTKIQKINGIFGLNRAIRPLKYLTWLIPWFVAGTWSERPLSRCQKSLHIGPNLACIKDFSALSEGWDDFLSMPTYPVFVGLFYAVAGIALFAMTSFGNALHLAFPLAAGFALIGPFVAISLCEMSRRRERGLAVTWRDAFTVLRSPALPSILALGLILLAIFVAWILAAEFIYVWLFGPNPPAAAIPFVPTMR